MSTESQEQEGGAILVNPEVVFRQDRALIDQQIATARAFPRSIKRATQNIVDLVSMDKETAETCNYALPRGGKVVTGPTVHLAKMIYQQWGNMRMEAKVVATDQTHVTSQAIAFDLETNIAVKVEIKRSIVDSKGKRYNNDMITVTGNAGNSIALRNAVFAVIPKAVVDKAIKASKKIITGDISDQTKFNLRKKQVIDGFRETYKVTEEELLAAIGKNSVDHITGDDLIVLIGIAQALKDGDTTVEETFRPAKKKSKEEIEVARMEALIKNAKTLEALKKLMPDVPVELMELYKSRETELTK